MSYMAYRNERQKVLRHTYGEQVTLLAEFSSTDKKNSFPFLISKI
jgi:hypothetical protein